MLGAFDVSRIEVCWRWAVLQWKRFKAKSNRVTLTKGGIDRIIRETGKGSADQLHPAKQTIASPNKQIAV